MDYSTIIVAAITGVFSILAILLQKRNNSFDDHLTTQNNFISKTREAERKITEDREKMNKITREILLVILETNIYILQGLDDQELISNISQQSQKLKVELEDICNELEDLSKEQIMRKEIECMMEAELKRKNESSKK